MGIFTLKTFVACTTDILKTYDDYFNNPPTLILPLKQIFTSRRRVRLTLGAPGACLHTCQARSAQGVLEPKCS